MATYFYWETFNHDIVKICRSYAVCARKKRQTKKPYLHIMPKCAFHTTSNKIIGQIKRTSASTTERDIIATVDHFTKQVED